MTNTGPSALLIKVFQALETHHIRYVVLRNFQGYPDAITGDVDLSVEPCTLRRLPGILEHLFRTNGWLVLEHTQRHYGIKYRLFSVDGVRRDRPYMGFDIFAGINWYGFPYLSFDAVWKRHVRWEQFRSVCEEDATRITLLHRALHGGKIPTKYKHLDPSILLALAGSQGQSYDSPWSRCRLEKLCTMIKGESAGELRSFRKLLIADIIRQAGRRCPIGTMKRCLSLLMIYVAKVVSSSGRIMLIHTHRLDQRIAEEIAKQLEDSVIRFSLFNEVMTVVYAHEGSPLRQWRAMCGVLRTMRKMGLVVVFADGSRALPLLLSVYVKARRTATTKLSLAATVSEMYLTVLDSPSYDTLPNQALASQSHVIPDATQVANRMLSELASCIVGPTWREHKHD